MNSDLLARLDFRRKTIASIIETLQTNPLAKHIRIFGSIILPDTDPMDVDVFVDLTNAADTDLNGLRMLLDLSRAYYGWVDPFILDRKGVLWCRNEESTQWIQAKNAHELTKAGLNGVPLSEMHPILESAETGVRLRNDVKDYAKGSLYGSIYAIKDGALIGRLDYAATQGEAVDVHWIEVADQERRRGLGSELVNKLRDEFPEQKWGPVEWGMMTPDGLKLRRALDESIPPSEKAKRFIKKAKKSFRNRYGKNWERALYATAWKHFGESAGDDNDILTIARRHAANVRGDGFDQCHQVSDDLARELASKGHPARVLRLSGFLGTPVNPDRRWTEKGMRPYYWIHYVVDSDGLILDLTRRQFDSTSANPFIQSFRSLEREWDNISVRSDYTKLDEATPDGEVSILPAPQRWLDPSHKDHRPGLADYAKGGRYLAMPNKDDLTGEQVRSAFIDVASGRPIFKVVRGQALETEGPIVRTNLFKKSAGWRWEGREENVAETDTLVSVETRGKHLYSLRTEFPDGVILARYPDSKSEPRLRPTSRGVATTGKEIGSIVVRGVSHPVYDKITIHSTHVVKEGMVGEIANHRAGISVPVWRVTSANQLEKLAEVGTLRAMLEADGLFVWQGDLATHRSYEDMYGAGGTRLMIERSPHGWGLEYNIRDIDEEELRSNRFLNKLIPMNDTSLVANEV